MTDFDREALALLMEWIESEAAINDRDDTTYHDHFRKRVEKAIRDRVFRVIPRGDE